MNFLAKPIDDYIVAHSATEPPLLKALTRETYQKMLQPNMLSSPYQGRLLSLLSKLIKPKTVLEIGTYTGYATLCLAEGLAPNGVIDTIDCNVELLDFQRKYFMLSEYNKQIVQHTGNAVNIIPNLHKTYDLVFIDADKPNYCTYFNLVIEKLNSGGILLSDNVLWYGKVTEPIATQDEATKAIVAYNQLLKGDKRIETIVLPIRDGLSISRKL